MTASSSVSVPPRPCAVVIGLDDGTTGIQTARILSRRNVEVIALAKNLKHHCCRTNACKQIVQADIDSIALIESLEQIGAQFARRPVLFPCQDRNVLLVSRHRDRLARWFHIVLPDAEIVEMMMNKAAFYRFAEQRGLPIPRTFVLSDRNEAVDAARSLEYPCILKPNIRSPQWMHNSYTKAFKVSGPDELLRLYDDYHQWADAMIAQQWIEGPDSDHYSCNCYFDAESRPVVTFTTRKLRQWPLKTGQGCLGVECRNHEVVQITHQTFASIPYRGLAYLEVKRDARTGEYFIIEPNVGRPTGRSATSEAAGVELMYTMYCDALGLPLPEDRTQRFEGVKWVYLRQDLQAAISQWRGGELSFHQWWQSWRGKKTYAIFSWRDPRPFIGDLLRVGRLAMSSNERRKRQYDQSHPENDV